MVGCGMSHYRKVNVPVPLGGVDGNVNLQNLFQSLVGTFYHPYGLGVLYSSEVDLDSGSFHYFGHDAGCEGSAFVSDYYIRDVGVLGEYLHECFHHGFRIWFSDRYREQITREVVARRQDMRISV